MEEVIGSIPIRSTNKPNNFGTPSKAWLLADLKNHPPKRDTFCDTSVLDGVPAYKDLRSHRGLVSC
jgi:hypothetical protein